MLRRTLPRVEAGKAYICSECLSRLRPTKRALHTSLRRCQTQPNVLALLEERGYISQLAGSRPVLERLLQTRSVGFYSGVDPTAPSLHLGHLLPMMVLFWLALHGHRVVSLVGGATARVGDPSGRLISRVRTAEEDQKRNLEGMKRQVGRVWGSAMEYAQRRQVGLEAEGKGRTEYQLLDNASWLDGLNVLDFLRYMGNGMRVGTMLGRETVKNKMEKGDGMSFSEFTYPLLQGWDWWHIYRTTGVQVQIGGSDQYGNIVAGMDALKYMAQSHETTSEREQWLDAEGRLREDCAPMGLTVPLLTTSSGEKFGKSAGNAIWLDRNMTSSFDLYGSLLRSSDADVARYLKLFTFAPTNEIHSVMKEHSTDPGKRKAQHLLATEVLELVHGREEAQKTRAEHEAMRNPDPAALLTRKAPTTSAPGSPALDAENGQVRIPLPESVVLENNFARLLFHAGLAQSKTDGARAVARGGVYVLAKKDGAEGEGEYAFRAVGEDSTQRPSDNVMDGLLVLRLGKWKVRTIEVTKEDGCASK